MAKPKHRDITAEARRATPEPAATAYDPGGHVGQLHERLEQQLSAIQMTAALPRPAPLEPVEQFIHSVSRISGPVALIAALTAIVWGVLAALS